MRHRIAAVLLLTLALLTTLGWTGQCRAQAKIARIGFLGAAAASGYASYVEGLRMGLRDLGYVEGKNIVMEFRWAEGKYERLPELAAELVRLKVDLIVTHGTPGTRAARQATTTIPVVMATSGDAVASGLIASLARPGGNVTGSTYLQPELMGKRLELLKEIIPRIARLGVLVNPDNPLFAVNSGPAVRAMRTTANAMKIALQPFEARGTNEFDSVFSAMAKKRVDAVEIVEDGLFLANARAIADLAAKQKLPSAGFKEFADAGGLIGYGVNNIDMFRRAAVFVDKILKGAKPGDLPVEQPTKFELVINMKTANALGIKIPNSILVRADKVIE